MGKRHKLPAGSWRSFAAYGYIFSTWLHGRPHIGANGQLTPLKNGWKIKKRKHAKKSSFLNGGEVIRVMTGWSGGKGALTHPIENPADPPAWLA